MREGTAAVTVTGDISVSGEYAQGISVNATKDGTAEISVTGDITAPEPDKYVRVTFRTAAGVGAISSLQSLGLPETAIPSDNSAVRQDPAQEAQTDAAASETTTQKQIVITWD